MRKLLYITVLALVLAGCSDVRRAGPCVRYASQTVAQLRAAHIEAYYIEFRWERRHYHGYHAAVIFRAAGGRWAISDNERGLFIGKIGATSVLQLVQQQWPEAVSVRVGGAIPL